MDADHSLAPVILDGESLTIEKVVSVARYYAPVKLSESCYEAIECMKNGETLIVTLDVLGSEGERIRCQDMLAGAAFTLQCTVRTLNSIGVVVIAPPGVKILPEQQTRRYEEQNEYSMPVQPYPSEAYSSPRERRASRNAVGWERAEKAGERGINPYTGSMPAAAGDYGVYGGYM